MVLYRRVWVALGLAMLFLTATAVETMVVLPAITPTAPGVVTSSRS